MHPGVHRSILRAFRRLPTPARRRIVRTFAPSYTVGSMCFVERDDGALLLVQHSYRRRWGVPGGLVKRGESTAAAALRETREEVGIDIVLVGEPAVVVASGPQRVDVVYRARLAPGVEPGDARPASPEIASLRWFPRRDLPELQHETAGAFVALARSLGTGEADLVVPGPDRDRSG